MKNKSKESLIQKKLFRETCAVMVCQALSQQGSGFIDGLITSIFLGSMAMGASGITQPFFSIIGVFSGMLMLGTQKLFIDFLGKGEKEKARIALSTAITVSIFLSIVLFLLLFFAAGPIVQLLGARGNAANLYADAKNNLIGLSLGVPAFILVPVLTPIAQSEGKIKYVGISIAAIALSDIVLDLIVAKTGLGLFGMGLATSIAQWLGLFIILVPLLIKPIIYPSIRICNIKYLIDIVEIGIPIFVRRTCNTLRPILVNTIVITIGSGTAMSAMSMRNNFSNITECLSNGIGAAFILLTSLYVGEQNKDALNTLRKSSMKRVLFIEVLYAFVIYILAVPITDLYVKDNLQVRNYLIVAIRCIAINTPLLAVSEVIQSYAQGIGKINRSNLLSLLSRLVYLVISIFVLGNLFGISGIWIAFPVASLLTIVTAITMEYFESKKNGIELLFPIPEECNINDNDKIVQRIDEGEDAINQIVKTSEDIHSFCIQHEIDEKRAMFVALCYEEIACNIFEHNKPLKNRKITIDVFVAITDNNINIRLRDNCTKFNIVEKYNTCKYDPNHPEKNLGIRVVMKSAKSVEYINTFGMNNLIITL